MVKAYVIMNCVLGFESEVITSLRKINDVREAHGTLGLYDVIVQLESDSDTHLEETITMIRKIPKINSTITLTRSESGELFQTSEKLIDAMLGKNCTQAYVVIHCDKGQEYTTLKNLSYISEVKEADVIFGFYDLICKVEALDEQILANIVTKAIRSLPHIKTSMTLNIVKEQES
jgi:DNA-binding Lrp family transcriptional regulator